MDPLVLLTASTLMALLFGVAGLHKLRAPTAFRATLAEYRLLPASFLPSTAVLLPVLELAIAAGFLLDAVRPMAAAVSVAILALYAGAMTINVLRGRRDLSCGCTWAADDHRQARTISLWLVGRNVGLMALAGLALMANSRETSWLDRLDGTAGGIVVMMLWVTFERLLLNQHLIQLRRPS